jgi:hypothetical protein
MRVVFRLISLWFNLAQNEAVSHELQAAAREVPSHKFLPLVYQIASRMSKSQTEEPSVFQTVLIDLVLKLASEHPYHSLYQVGKLWINSGGWRILTELWNICGVGGVSTPDCLCMESETFRMRIRPRGPCESCCDRTDFIRVEKALSPLSKGTEEEEPLASRSCRYFRTSLLRRSAWSPQRREIVRHKVVSSGMSCHHRA